MSIKSKLKVYTVEDDPSYALELEMMVNDLGLDLIGHSDDVKLASYEISQNPPDIILSDIYLGKGGTGFELATKFSEIPIIYLTAFSDEENYKKAKDLKSKAFLVKPFDKLTLMNVIENSIGLDQLSKDSDHLISKNSVFIKHKNQLIRLYFNEIVSIHSEGNYCTIQATEKKYVLRISLKKIKEQLDDPNLIQVHRAYLVREDEIQKIDLARAELITSYGNIPIGRNYKKDLISRLPKI